MDIARKGQVELDRYFHTDRRSTEKPRTTNVPLREPHIGVCSLPKSSWEAVGTFDAPSWKYTGSQESTVSWGSLGTALESSRSSLYPSKTIWHFSQKMSPAVLF